MVLLQNAVVWQTGAVCQSLIGQDPKIEQKQPSSSAAHLQFLMICGPDRVSTCAVDFMTLRGYMLHFVVEYNNTCSCKSSVESSASPLCIESEQIEPALSLRDILGYRHISYDVRPAVRNVLCLLRCSCCRTCGDGVPSKMMKGVCQAADCNGVF